MKAIIDIETTGFRNSDRIVEIAIVKFNDEGIQSKFNMLINPTIPIPVDATLVHKITDKMVKDCPTFEEAITDILPHLEFNDCFIAHNAPFEKRMLGAELSRIDYSIDREFICTLQMARDSGIKPKAGFGLESLAMHFDLDHKPSHRALDDCLATYELLKKLS